MTDYLPPPPPGPPARPAPSAASAAGTPTSKDGPSQEQIEAILAKVEQEHRARFPAERTSLSGALANRTPGSLIARVLFAAAGLMLISNGLEGLNTRAVSSDSLIARSINRQGGQSVGLGLAMFALASMPYPSRQED